MLKRCLAFFVLLFAIAAVARAQTITTVTGTITDPNSIPYAGAQVLVNINPPGVTSPAITATGQPILFPITAQTNANGAFSMQLVANASITPGGTQYTFRICTPAIAPPFGTGISCIPNVTLTIAGASQDISVAENAVAPALANIPRSPAGTSWSTFISGAIITSVNGFNQLTLGANITVTHIDFASTGAVPNCSVAPTVIVSDGTTPITLTIANAAFSTAAFSQVYSAAAVIKVNTTAGTCTTAPNNMNVVVSYK